MKKILNTLFVLTFMASFAMGQVQFDIPVSFTINGTTSVLHLGVSGDGPGGAITDNTIGVDIGLEFGAFSELLAPPAPPAPYNMDLRFLTPAGYPTTLPTGLGSGVTTDFRGFTSSTQVDTFRIKISSDDGNGSAYTPWNISWPANLNLYGTVWTMKPATGSDFPVTNMLTSTSVNFTPSGTSLFILVIKTGATQPAPGPTFALNNSTLNFGTVNIGASATQSVIVTNTGTTNALSITGVTTIPEYTVVPNPAAVFPIVIASGASRTFDVTFTPTASSEASGNIVFAHDATGGTTNLAVIGNRLLQGGTLAFAGSNRLRYDNTNAYLDSLTLNSIGNPLKALQFQIVTNGLVIIRSISRGSAIPAPAWSFNSVITRGYLNADGSSNDTIKVVILGNGTTSLPAGYYNNFVNFQYDAVNIVEPDTQRAQISIQNVFSSLFDGQPALIKGSADQTLTVINHLQLGDINADDRINILDLLMIIDHILNKITLTGQDLTRADIAPWGAPDGVVNVLDLALLQNIILTGQYPNGVRFPKVQFDTPVVAVKNESGIKDVFAKSELAGNAKVTYYITEKGIVVRLENKVAVKGLQIDFDNIDTLAITNNVTSYFGNSSFKVNNGSLRLLVFSESGAVLEPGTHIVATIPFAISDPSKIKPSELTLAGSDNAKIKDVEATISLSDGPELPMTYSLAQNYPNPFNPATTIQFQVPEDGMVSIAVYNLLGQEVRTLFSGDVKRGTYAARWNGNDNFGKSVASGIYIYRMTSGKFFQTRKMMLMK